MDFYIEKGATLPLLKLQILNDGRLNTNDFTEYLEVSSIFFSMINVETGEMKIQSDVANLTTIQKSDGIRPEYYIYYQFSKNTTNVPGTYQGQFLIKNNEGNTILPIREDLYIHIKKNYFSSDEPNF